MVLESLIKGFKTAINVIKVLTINTAKSSKDVMKVIIVFTNQYCSDCHGFQDCYYSYRISLAMQACLVEVVLILFTTGYLETYFCY